MSDLGKLPVGHGRIRTNLFAFVLDGFTLKRPFTSFFTGLDWVGLIGRLCVCLNKTPGFIIRLSRHTGFAADVEFLSVEKNRWRFPKVETEIRGVMSL